MSTFKIAGNGTVYTVKNADSAAQAKRVVRQHIKNPTTPIWQMTLDEYRQSMKGKRIHKSSGYYNREGVLQEAHKGAITDAKQLGYPIPARVIEDAKKQYPVLKYDYPYWFSNPWYGEPERHSQAAKRGWALRKGLEQVPVSTAKVREQKPRKRKEPWQIRKEQYIANQYKDIQAAYKTAQEAFESAKIKYEPGVSARDEARRALELAESRLYGKGPEVRHLEWIQHALDAGRKVPSKVLADYPDLVAERKAKVSEQRRSRMQEYWAKKKAPKEAIKPQRQQSREADAADKWLADVVSGIKAIQDEHGPLLQKKSLTDRYARAVREGQLTQEKYNDAVARGAILNKEQYQKAQGLLQQIEEIKNQDMKLPEPEPEALTLTREAIIKEAKDIEQTEKVIRILGAPSRQDLKDRWKELVKLANEQGFNLYKELGYTSTRETSKLPESKPETPSGKPLWEMTKKELYETYGNKDQITKLRAQLDDRELSQHQRDILWATLREAQEPYVAKVKEQKTVIAKALKDGQPVPKEVLADHPDLVAEEIRRKKSMGEVGLVELTKTASAIQREKGTAWALLEKDYIKQYIERKADQAKKQIEAYQKHLDDKDYKTTKQKQNYELQLRLWQNELKYTQQPSDSQKEKLREEYRKIVKKAISSGEPVPEDVIAQYKEFTTAVNARERYEKGWKTSFANKSAAVSEQLKETRGYKIKRQDGKAITQAQVEDIDQGVKDIEEVFGEQDDLFKKTDLTIAHTSGKAPFLMNAGGVYHPSERTISTGVGSKVTGQDIPALGHEWAHWLDAEAGNAEGARSRLQAGQGKVHYTTSMAEARQVWRGNDLISDAIRSMNSDYRVRMLKRRKPENLTDAEKAEIEVVKVKLGPYWTRPVEVFARLVEQYMARKLGRKNRATSSNTSYTSTPGYWSDKDIERFEPKIKEEVEKRIRILKEHGIQRNPWFRMQPGQRFLHKTARI